jgi:2-methylisocitrate lyase-like PEP mutase family enzyme
LQVTAQLEKCSRFAELHQQHSAWLIPNPWDVGSARVLQGLGFGALATTSSGFA